MTDRRNITRLLNTALVGAVLLVRPVAANPPWIATGQNGMVAADSPQASKVGAQILQAGGNAIDAAVAVSFALAVTRPQSTGLGGGGFMIARFADGRVVVQDFRETAPSAATPDMYIRAKKANPTHAAPARFGYLAVAVPGVVAGRCQALARYGTMSIARVIAPAIRLAQNGFRIDEHYVDAVRAISSRYQRSPELKESCRYVYETHLREGRLPQVGEILRQPNLARLLEGIASGGAEFFYRGPVAYAIAAAMKKHGGIITRKDLAAYKVKQRQPILSTYGEYEIVSMPPPSSGGVALAQTLNILEASRFSVWAKKEPVLAMHFQIEAMKHAFADRARWLGDADFADVPVAMLTSKVYAVQSAIALNPNGTASLDIYGSTNLPDDSGTSHVCVVDDDGNSVVTSETISTSFGSLAAIGEWGLILNNEMDDFVSEPGKPNAFGLIQSKSNAIQPGKRPLSSMTPTIILKKDKPYLLLGASGGPRIISSVLNVLLCVIDFGMTLEDAMTNLRPHHQWQPDVVVFDQQPPESIKRGLLKRGHTISDRRKTGVVQAILRIEDGWMGASDPRKGGRPAGY